MGMKKQYIPLLLLTLFVLWQVDSLVHLLVIPHAVCEHGKVVDSESGSEHSEHNHGKKRSNHRGCGVLSALTSAETRVSDPPCPISMARVVKTDAAFVFVKPIPWRKGEIFEMSPSHSPPSFS